VNCFAYNIFPTTLSATSPAISTYVVCAVFVRARDSRKLWQIFSLYVTDAVYVAEGITSSSAMVCSILDLTACREVA
jgi:hypothetical protein